MPAVRPAVRRMIVALLVGMMAACGVLELGGGEHHAVVVGSAQSFEAERWSVVAELLATDISGATVIALSFADDQIRCADGSDFDPQELVQGTEFRFEQRGDVAESDPPQVTGVDLEVDCG
jgi:hypothetical protein